MTADARETIQELLWHRRRWSEKDSDRAVLLWPKAREKELIEALRQAAFFEFGETPKRLPDDFEVFGLRIRAKECEVPEMVVEDGGHMVIL